MAAYDYVQIVVDSDWGLVGIVPPGGAGDRVKKLSIKPEVVKAAEPPKPAEASKLVETVIPSREIRRKPLPQIITKHDPTVEPPRPSPEPVKPVDKNVEASRNNPHALSGIANPSSPHRHVATSNYDQFPEAFGNLSGRTVAKSRDNLLVGFGK
jgi:hypothetical protein